MKVIGRITIGLERKVPVIIAQVPQNYRGQNYEGSGDFAVDSKETMVFSESGRVQVDGKERNFYVLVHPDSGLLASETEVFPPKPFAPQKKARSHRLEFNQSVAAVDPADDRNVVVFARQQRNFIIVKGHRFMTPRPLDRILFR